MGRRSTWSSPQCSMSEPAVRFAALGLIACGWIGCTGTIVDGAADPHTHDPSESAPRAEGAGGINNPPAPGPGAPGGAASSTSPMAPEGSLPSAKPTCEIGAPAAVVPRRLTRAELSNTLEDAFGVTVEAKALPQDSDVGGFSGNRGQALAVSEVEILFEAMMDVSRRGAGAVAKDLGCALSEGSCVDRFLDRWGRRLFRRTLSGEERDRLRAFVNATVTKWGPSEALPLVLAGMLTAPQFLHVIEGGRVQGGVRIATPEELVTRWALALFQSAPTPALLEAAARGETETPEGRAAILRAMLRDPKAKRGIGQFHIEWIEVDALEGDKDAKLFPMWNDAVADRAKDEVRALASDVLAGGAGFAELMTSRKAVVDQSLGGLYGATVPQGSRLAPVVLGPERAGILSRAAFLALDVHGAEVVTRGYVVRVNMLCDDLPPPPADVDQTIPDRVANPTCSPCHRLMDSIGFGFEAYDGIGRYQPISKPSGASVVHPGGIDASDPVVGTFEGLPALGARLAASPRAQHCYMTTLLRYSLRTGSEPWQGCAAAKALEGLPENASLESMIVALLAGDTYRAVGTTPSGQ
jgi:hypothetical protein